MNLETQLKQQVKELIKKGYSVEKAVELVFQSSDLENRADELLKLKQQIEWEMKFG